MNIDEYIETSDALFHYTKTSIAIEHILPTKKFKPSILEDTNDPSEYKFKLFNTIGWGRDDNMFKLSDQAQPVINRILRRECKIMAFCTNNKATLILNGGKFMKDENACSKGWCKSRMWSQYSQNHRGVCLVFSHKRLKKALDAYKPHVSASMADFVKYSQQNGIDQSAITINGNKLEIEGVEKYSYDHVKNNYEKLLFQKHIDYRDEAEFRVVVIDPNKKFEYLDISSLIKCVIVGDKISKAYIPLINQMCADLNIESRRADWDRGEPNLLLCKI